MASVTDLIHQTYGAQLLGSLVATFLSGTNTLQTIVYFRVYHEDSMKLKALVTAVWGLDIIHTAFLWSDLWFYLIANFGQLFQIYIIQKPDIVPGAIVFCSSLMLIVHLFYVQRIFRFSHRNYWITTPIFVLVLCDVACAIGAIVILYRFQDFSTFINSGYTWIFSLGFIFPAVSDIAIMVVLFILLQSSRRRSISMNNAINQLVIYTLETGSLTAFLAFAIMIAWLTDQNNDIYFGLYMSLPKLYALGLLGLLNIRHRLRHGQDSQRSPGHSANRMANLAGHSESTNPTSASLMQISQASTEIQHIHVDVEKSVCIGDEEKNARV